MQELKIDFSDLEMAFESGDLPGAFYLDRETGKAVLVSDEIMRMAEEGLGDEGLGDDGAKTLPDWQQEELKTAILVLQGCDERFIRFPRQDSREGYRDMDDFAATVDDERLKELLAVALDGKGAFRRFKDVLARYPDQRQQWFAFERRRVRERIVRWLETLGITPIETS
ncbi:MAG TPA: UPF0158 family protein [Pirellulales bacterium]|nr:UPF0158 family protein [Pirellulales bacterium]